MIAGSIKSLRVAMIWYNGSYIDNGDSDEFKSKGDHGNQWELSTAGVRELYKI